MKANYKFLDALILRSPYYSFARYDLHRLGEVLLDNFFRTAIWLASPVFYSVLENVGFDIRKLDPKAVFTLRKYYNRMCFRPVPFGAFAAFTVLEWGAVETVRLGEDDTVLLHLLPDHQLILKHLATGRVPLAHLPLMINPSFYQVAGEYRYVSSIPDKNGKYQFSIEALAAEVLYQRLVETFEERPMSPTETASWIVKQTGCSVKEATEHVDFLINEQVLVGFAAGAVIGSPNGISAAAGWPESGKDGIGFYRQQPITLSVNQPVWQQSVKWQQTDPVAGESVFYAALERRPDSQGPLTVIREELQWAIKVLSRLAVPVLQHGLEQFIRDFSNRYDQQRVPLLLALDPDTGLDYHRLNAGDSGTGPLDGLQFQENLQENDTLLWTAVHKLIFKLWLKNARRDRYDPIVIGEEDMSNVPDIRGNVQLPNTMAVVFRQTEDHLLVESAGGVTANSLLGRFTLFNDKVASLAVDIAIREAQANPDVVFADIAQLSHLHIDNINRRKRIYPYEISLNGYPAPGDDGRILPNDLFLSVRDGQLIMESSRLGKRVIPRLASAYNYKHNEFAPFRLLCDLQYQGLDASLTFNLEQFFPGLDFYPRVCHGRIIISPARWIFGEAHLVECTAPGNDADMLARFRLFRENHHLPQRVAVGRGDQQLVFDLTQSIEVLFLIRYLKGRPIVTLHEYLLPDRSVMVGHRPLAGQYLAIAHHNNRIYSPITKPARKAEPTVKRNFPPGSEWLYVKLYCTSRAADLILKEVIGPVVAGRPQLTWFFIRFTDPGYHLRIRFSGSQQTLTKIMTGINMQLKITGRGALVHDYYQDTYRRELERYGPDLIISAERLFCTGSRLVMHRLLNEEDDTTEFQTAFLTALGMICHYFSDLVAATNFTRRYADSLLAELRADKALRKDCDEKYRTSKREILIWIEEDGPAARHPDTQVVAALFQKQLTAIKDVVCDRPVSEQEALLADLVHMQLNRIFSSRPRQQEMLVYYFLDKHLRSSLAKQLRKV